MAATYIGSALIVFFFLTLCHAQNSPQDLLDAHNAAREQVRVGPMVWDADFAAYAENYARQRADDCQMRHSDGEYGDNIIMGSGVEYTAADAVSLWVNESNSYDYGSNSCAPGQMCGHYTQVVWKGSVKLGCTRAECSNGGVFITCNYDPPGNVNGERPY